MEMVDFNARGNRHKNKKQGDDTKEKRNNARWDHPLPSWIKIDFNLATKGNLGPIGYSAITNDEERNLIKVISIQLGTQTNHVTYVMDFFNGVKLARNLKPKGIWIKGISLSILNFISKGVSSLWTIENDKGS